MENHFYALPYVCGQYPDLCPPATIAAWWVPAQQQYLSDYTRPGTHLKPGNGGFFHSCYLGTYMTSDFASTDPVHVPRKQNGIWNEISVGGKTIQEAVSLWWNGDDSKPAAFAVDHVWNASGVPPTTLASTPLLSVKGVVAQARAGKTPIVPWYTNKYISNPTCRGYPWY